MVTLGTALLPLAAPSPAAAVPAAVPAEVEVASAEVGSAPPWIGLTAPGRGVQLLYRGDLRESGAVADSSGHGLDGTIETGGGGTVTSVRAPRNTRFLRFPGGSCLVAPCPQGIVRPPSGSTLAPADGTFSFGADVRLAAPPPTAAGMNVLQFGAAAAGLSQWKVQVD